jgi:hypothetical protein
MNATECTLNLPFNHPVLSNFTSASSTASVSIHDAVHLAS